jgi:hypothetical protein
MLSEVAVSAEAFTLKNTFVAASATSKAFAATVEANPVTPTSPSVDERLTVVTPVELERFKVVAVAPDNVTLTVSTPVNFGAISPPFDEIVMLSAAPVPSTRSSD